MDRYLYRLRIRSSRDVLLWTGIITAISVAAPVVTLAVPMALMPNVSSRSFWTVLAICAAIPLLIAPPISLFALGMLRLLTMTIDRVDEYVRYDHLTGVLTRAYLLGKLRESLPNGGAFLMADADHFKAINDTYGHDVGDEALKRLAEVLRLHSPTDAIVGRLGGEEFGVFLPGANDAGAAEAAAALCKAMRAKGETVAGHGLRMTISIGGAVHVKGHSLEKTMKLADSALYLAKRSGRDQFYIAAATDTMPALILKSQSLSA